MPSSYPAALDSSFPGYPYLDNVEYVMANFANSWVLAIQAVEGTIGFGTGSTATNPLYSVQFNKSFTTLTARLAAVEVIAANAVSLDESDADIQPVGSVANAGRFGFGADVKHVHVGVRSFNGRTGVVTTTAQDFGALFTAAGQLLVGTGNGTSEALPVGPPGSVLTVGAGDASGLAWATSSVAGTFSPGDLKFTSAVVPQTGWLVANAQAVSRTTYVNLFGATTVQTSGVLSNSSQNITGIPSAATAFMGVGMPIECPGFIPGNTTVTSVSATSITISNPASGGGSQNFTVFPNGNGNGSTTFNVIDMRGRFPLGTGGTGGNQSPVYAMGATGGEQTHGITTAEMAGHSHPLSDPGHSHGVNDGGHAHSGGTGTEIGTHTHPLGQRMFPIISGGQFLTPYAGGQPTGWGPADSSSENVPHTHTFSTSTSTTGIYLSPSNTNVSMSSVGGGQAHNNMPPFAVGQYLVKT